jgi:cytochrome c556
MRNVTLMASALALACAAGAAAREPAHGQEVPASLDRLYPPQADAPLFHLAMLEVGHAMSALVADLVQGDLAGARRNHETFATAWSRVAGMVPEWKARFPKAPVDALGKALGQDAPKAAFAVLEPVGRTCHECHVSSMAAVQFRYHWTDFREIDASLGDPPATVSFTNLMQRLEQSMAGIGNDLKQGQLDRARGQARAFAQAFRAMGETCDGCHRTERHYYVDAGMLALVDRLDQAVAADAPDPAVVGGLLQRIGQESCGPCHRVHIPAAYSKHAPPGDAPPASRPAANPTND